MNKIDEKFSAEQFTLELSKLIEEKILYRDSGRFILDVEKLSEYDLELMDYLISNPLEFIDRTKNDLNDKFNERKLSLINVKEDEQISNIRIKDLDKIVKISGTLSNATSMLALVKLRKFECPSCGTVITVYGGDEPKKCSCGRRGGFKVTYTEFQDMQEIILEENQDEIDGRDPKKTRIRLLEDLCDKEMNGIVSNGNKIEVIGVVQSIQLKKSKIDGEEIHEFRIFALQLKSLENEFDETISDEDIKQIEEIAALNPLDKLSKSLSPSIIGHENIKKSIVLSMVGGTPRTFADGKREKDKIHLMLIGDAGQGKTVLLQDAVRRHYKSRYMTGERLSEVGLCGGVEKDELLGNWILKAGALPKTNGGFVSLDELDKSQRSVQKSLHTPMESGIVSINKAGINSTLNADCTVLIGANPKGSKFDMSAPLVNQINMESTLLSRLDLIFIMQDSLNSEHDKLVAESVIFEKEEEELMEVTLFKKYLKYTQNFKPKLTDESGKKLVEFYYKIRKKSKRVDSKIEGMPIVPRQLKGIKRLSEASAKLRLSEIVEIEDMNIAIELFKESLIKLGMEDDGTIDFARIGPGRTAKTKNKMSHVLDVIRMLSVNNKVVNEVDIKINCKDKVTDDEVEKSVEELNRDGTIYSPQRGKWILIK